DELCFRELAFVFSRARFAHRLLLVHHLTCWEQELAKGPRARARQVEATLLRHCDHLIVTSEASRSHLRREGYRRGIDAVLPGADRLARLSRPDTRDAARPVRLLFVGAIIPRKRVLDLVHAFSLLPHSLDHAELRLVGSKSHDPAYAATVEREASRA